MSKFLNRIAPQDEVLLETDIGTMIPSAEQLAEERVTRFNADKEIRLRVKALEEKAPDAAVEAAKTQALAAIDTKAQSVNTALDSKIASANTAIDGKVTEANQAKTDAVTAKERAEQARDEAVASATNVMRYAIVEEKNFNGDIYAQDRTILIASISFGPDGKWLLMPPQVDGKARDFLLVLKDCETRHEFIIEDGITLLPRDGDDSHLVPEEGTNVFMFTEIMPNTFMVSRTKVVETSTEVTA